MYTTQEQLQWFVNAGDADASQGREGDSTSDADGGSSTGVPRAELTAISACSKLEFEPPRLAVGWKVVDMTAAGGVAPNSGELRASNAAVGRVGEINDDGTYQVHFPALPGARADAPTTVVRTLRMSDIEAYNEGHNGIWPFVVSAQLSGQQQDGGPRAVVMKFATRTEAERSAWLSVLLA